MLLKKIHDVISSRSGVILTLVWGFAEAIFFFVVPDVFFCFAALLKPSRGVFFSILSAGAAVPGGLLMYHWGRNTPAVNDFLTRIPGIDQDMVASVHQSLAAEGLSALWQAPWQAIPYKIYAAQAGILKCDAMRFALVSLGSRLERMLLLGLLAAAIGVIFKDHIKSHPRGWAVFYITLWLAWYGFYAYFLTIR